MIRNELPLIANSLWTATAGPAPAAPPLTGEAEAEVAVVGGGITGLSAAVMLAQRGISVRVLEAQTPGWGASGRNGGQLNPGLKLDPETVEARFGAEVAGRMLKASGDAPDFALSLIRRYAIDCDAVQPGWIQAAHNEKAMAVIRARAAQWARRGVALRLLSREEITDMVGAPVYIGGLLDPRGGNLHPLKFSLGLVRAATGLGAVVHGGSRVMGMRRDGAGHLLVTPQGVLRARRVLLCTNGYTDGLRPPLARTLVPVRSVQVATEPLPADLRAQILPGLQAVSDTRRVMVYYKLDAEGRLLMGGRGDYDERITGALLRNLRELTVKMYPQLAGVRFPFAWGGFVAMTADHLPHLTQLGDGVLSATGFNGRGLALAAVMGRVLADWASGADPSSLDFPITGPRPVPFYALRKPAVRAAIGLFRLQDALGL